MGNCVVSIGDPTHVFTIEPSLLDAAGVDWTNVVLADPIVEDDLGFVADDFADDDEEEPDVLEDDDVDDSSMVMSVDSADAGVVSVETVEDPHDARTAVNVIIAIKRVNDDFMFVMEFLESELYFMADVGVRAA